MSGGPTYDKTKLSPAMEEALIDILYCTAMIKSGSNWQAKNISIPGNTIRALWIRGLVMIVTESRHRTRQNAELTQIGEHVAKNLKRQRHAVVQALTAAFDKRERVPA
jgi:hypothetical protein